MSKEETMIAVIQEKQIQMENLIGDHERRLRSIEKTVWMAFGVATFIQIATVVAIEYLHK
jgi:hypothetical protein